MRVQKHRHNGFTIAELLIGLAIMGILLAALATAFDVTFMNHEENRKIAESMQVARTVTDMISRQARTADNVFCTDADPNDATDACVLTITSPADGSGLTSAIYTFDPAGGSLKYNPSDANEVTLLGRSGDTVKVTAFAADILVDPNTTKAVSTTVLLKFKTDGQEHEVTATACQRQNL
jgi:prepilin-type N-terminal cleavage/methylation domain-containing protein